MKKNIFSYLVLIASVTALFAQNNGYIISQKAYIHFSPTFQSWSTNSRFNIHETSLSLAAYYPINRTTSLSLTGNQAQIAGDVDKMSGFTDSQLQLSHHLVNANLVLSLGVNLPSGKKEFNEQEFRTSSQISYSFYNFKVPGFGQGLNLSPGLSWAAPLNDKIAVGFGVTYQYKGDFKPVENMVDSYKPGDEILITAGFDFQFSPATTFAADVIYTFYNQDKMGNLTVFEAGDRLTISGQLRSLIGQNELRIISRFRSPGKNSYYIGGIFQLESEKTTPNQFEGIGSFKLSFSPGLALTVQGEIRTFSKSALLPAMNIFGVGVKPEIQINKNFAISPRLIFYYGDVQGGTSLAGTDASIGLSYFF
ncbi:MAG TPA: hypothetical protein ENN22_16495 [bacterium]|nr:hypothetical protein [bacterium]